MAALANLIGVSIKPLELFAETQTESVLLPHLFLIKIVSFCELSCRESAGQANWFWLSLDTLAGRKVRKVIICFKREGC